MSELDHAHDELLKAARARLKINPGLESVLARKEVKEIEEMVNDEMRIQVYELLRSPMFESIDEAIGKAEVRVYTESDELEVEDAVREEMDDLADRVGETFADFLILVFNLGGQDFLNKHNIPATFDLKNKSVLNAVQAKARSTLAGVDDTTVKWVRDQIMDGKRAGFSNAQIADSIRDAVPQTYEGRAERIVRTETSHMVGESEQITADRNGAGHKEWVTVGDGTVCPICEANEGVGIIGIDEVFPSRDLHEPAHPNCRCLVEYIFTPFMGSTWHGQ